MSLFRSFPLLSAQQLADLLIDLGGVLVEHFQLVVGDIVLHLDQLVEQAQTQQFADGDLSGHQRLALLVEMQDDLHHLQLLLQAHISILVVEEVLLQEAHADDAGDLDDQLLVVGQHVGADQLDDLHQAGLLQQQACDLLTAGQEIRAHIVVVPGGQIGDVLGVAGVPVDGRVVTGIGQGLVQRPEATG